MHGHGLRERQLRGPLAPLEPPLEVVILVRRYRCTDCEAVVVVVPRGIAPRRLFTLAAIFFALHLWAIEGYPAREARRAVSPHRHVGQIAGWGWTSLGRWARAAAGGRLARKLRPVAPDGGRDLRGLARLVVQAVTAFAPPSPGGAPARQQVFAGAILAA